MFIHGFNVAFDDAIYRTAQIAYDLGFDGPPITYSWPSEGGVRNYTHDKTTNELTIPNLRWFLEDVVKRLHAQVVHVIAHSMGTYALVRALEQMESGGQTAPHLNSVILAAPDIDARVFTQLSSSITRAADHVVLYASSRDKALLASKEVNGDNRAGDVGPVTVIDGIDTVDASNLTTDFIGHSYSRGSRVRDWRHSLRAAGNAGRAALGTVEGPQRRAGLLALRDCRRVDGLHDNAPVRVRAASVT